MQNKLLSTVGYFPLFWSVLRRLKEWQAQSRKNYSILQYYTHLASILKYSFFSLMTLKEVWQIPLGFVIGPFWNKHIKCQGLLIYSPNFSSLPLSLVSSPRKPHGRTVKEKAAPRPLCRYCHFSYGWSVVSFSTTFELCTYFGSKSAPGEGKLPKPGALLHLLVHGVSTGWVPTVPIREKLFLQALLVNDLQWELLMALFITESCVVGHHYDRRPYLRTTHHAFSGENKWKLYS